MQSKFCRSQQKNYNTKKWLLLKDEKISTNFSFHFKITFHAALRERRLMCNRFSPNLDRNWRKCAKEENLLCLPLWCSLQNFPIGKFLSQKFYEKIFQWEYGNRKSGKIYENVRLIMNDNNLNLNYVCIVNSDA